MSRPARPPAKTQPINLAITRNSIRNTVLATSKDNISYEIRTTWWQPQITSIKKLDTELRGQTLIAEVSNQVGSDGMVRMNWNEGFQEFQMATSWLDAPMGAKFLGSFLGVDNKTRYQWIKRGRKLQLFKEGESSTPLVTFSKHRRHFYVYWRMSKPASLVIDPDCLRDLDAIVLSYLLIARRRRSRIHLGL